MTNRTGAGATLLAMALLAITACARDEAPMADAAPAPAAVTAADAEVATDVDDGMDTPAPAAGSSDPMDTQRLQLARMGGGMQALAETCGVDYDKAELEASKRQQREVLEAQGLSGRDFDAAFDAAYNEGRAKLQAASTAQRAEACAQMEQLGNMGQALQKR